MDQVSGRVRHRILLFGERSSIRTRVVNENCLSRTIWALVCANEFTRTSFANPPFQNHLKQTLNRERYEPACTDWNDSTPMQPVEFYTATECKTEVSAKDVEENDIMISLIDVMRLSGEPEARILGYGIVGVNFVVHLAFRLGIYQNRKQISNSSTLYFMRRHFVLSPISILRRRWHVLLTSVFAH